MRTRNLLKSLYVQVLIGIAAGVILGFVAPERGAAMRHQRRPDLDSADRPRGGRRVPELHACRQLPDLDRGERVRDVAGGALAQRAPGRGRAPDGEMDGRVEQWGEEHQPLDVVQVEVGQQDVHVAAAAGDRGAQLPDAGARIEDQLGPVGRGDSHARGVSPVAGRGGARHGDRSAHPPELHAQEAQPS